MVNPKISIVVPIYNVERFLDKCFNSIVNQTYRNIEIILIDDASPDCCNQMTDEYCLQDKRIQVIHQHNKWLGGARNSGIKYATGDYILFVDSDDYIRLDMCEKLMSYVKTRDVDMVVFDMQHVDVQYNLIQKSSPPIEVNHVFRGKDVQDVLYPLIISTHCVNSACMKLYKTFIHGERLPLFDEQIRYAEDYEYCLRLFPKLNSFVHYDEAFYYYVVNDESIMNKADPFIIDKFIVLYQYREKFLETYNLKDENHERLSANLFITMVVKNIPKYLGRNNKSSYKMVKKLLENQTVNSVIKKIRIEDLNFGFSGKSIFYGLKYKSALLILIGYAMMNA